jgi:hypothetical protein
MKLFQMPVSESPQTPYSLCFKKLILYENQQNEGESMTGAVIRPRKWCPQSEVTTHPAVMLLFEDNMVKTGETNHRALKRQELSGPQER